MRRCWIVLVLCPFFGCGGSLTGPAPGSPGPPPSSHGRLPLIASANHRYLVDQNGSPTLLVGDTAHSLFVNLDPAGLATYLADRKSRGFNILWVQSLCSDYLANCRSDMSTFDGIKPFVSGTDQTNYDISTPNPDYWSRVDRYIETAETYGLTILLDTWETGALMPLARSSGNTKMRNFGIFLANRYKNVPNLIWITGNDFQSWRDSSDNTLIQNLMAGIASIDSRHLQTTELDYFASGSLDDSLLVPYIGLAGVYDYFCSYAETLAQYTHPTTMPVFFLEGYYEYDTSVQGNTTTALSLRTQQWWAALSGATAGQLRGSERVHPFFAGWQDYLNTESVRQFDYQRRFLQSIPWYDLVPDRNHTLVTAGYGILDASENPDCINSNNFVTTSYLENGTASVSYAPKRALLSVDLSRFSGPVTARWYDPSDGKYSDILGSPFNNTGSQNFASPGNNTAGNEDWVLLLTASP